MKVDVSLIILLLSSIFLLCLIFWLIFHSEFVTHGEFLTSILGIFGAMLAGFWSLWSKISNICENIGFLRSEVLNMSKRVSKIEDDVKYIRKKCEMSNFKKIISQR